LSEDITEILGAAYATYPGEGVKPGVICMAVIPYVMETCYTIQPSDPDPRSSSHRQYKLVQKSPKTLCSDNHERWQLPFKDLNLDIDEALVAVKVKRRPVVVLSHAIVDERKADTSRIQDSFWCVPSYTLVDQFSHPQWDIEFIEDVFALTSRCFFPLPYDAHLHDRQSMLRFDRMQPIRRHLLKPTEQRLSHEWTLYLQEWARFYISGRLGDDDSDKNPDSIASALSAAREALMEELTKKRAQQKAN